MVSQTLGSVWPRYLVTEEPPPRDDCGLAASGGRSSFRAVLPLSAQHIVFRPDTGGAPRLESTMGAGPS
jgi:hypothetical protein